LKVPFIAGHITPQILGEGHLDLTSANNSRVSGSNQIQLSAPAAASRIIFSASPVMNMFGIATT
jgi:hypothetical protein